MSKHRDPSFRSNLPSGRRLLVLLVLGGAFISGCISLDSSYLAAEQYPAKQPSDPIEIVMKVPEKPHIVIGDISCRGGAFWGAADAQVVIDAMKARARAMGGDAIIKYSSHRAPVGTVGAGAYSAEGTVVRWK